MQMPSCERSQVGCSVLGRSVMVTARYLIGGYLIGGCLMSCCVISCCVMSCAGFSGADDVAPGDMTAVGALGVTGASAADWSCLGSPPAAQPSVEGTGNVRYSVLMRSLLGAPLSNVVARVCQAADIACATPLGESRGLSPEGLLTVDVPQGFAGFLEIESDGHLPTVFQLRQPVLRPTVDTQVLQPIPSAAVVMLTSLLNVELVPELGIVSVAVVDCQGVRAPGATFTNNLGGRSFYFADGVPDVMASATDISGLGGFVNVPIRLAEFSAELATDRRLIGTRRVLPRAGWLSVVQVRPPALPYE